MASADEADDVDVGPSNLGRSPVSESEDELESLEEDELSPEPESFDEEVPLSLEPLDEDDPLSPESLDEEDSLSEESDDEDDSSSLDFDDEADPLSDVLW